MALTFPERVRSPQLRTGAQLNQAVRPFAEEDRAKSWRLLAVTMAVLLGLNVLTALIPDRLWPLKVLAGLATGLAFMRPFIFYHDYLHGAIFRGSRTAEVIMTALGTYMLAPRSVWRETHNHHHKHNAQLTAQSIGTLPVVNVETWRAMSRGERFAYRAQRHPLVIFPAYVTFFIFGLSLIPFLFKSVSAKRRHWSGLVAVLVHAGVIVGLGLWLGWLTAFTVGILPLIVTSGLGSYLFYAQHNFPMMQLREGEQWDYTHAALRASSLFKMSRFMHWVTGNIGYHHVHHLNHRIPFYRLPETMAAIPELQDPGTTTWRPRDVLACLRLAVWSSELGRMLTWRELGRMRGAA